MTRIKPEVYSFIDYLVLQADVLGRIAADLREAQRPSG